MKQKLLSIILSVFCICRVGFAQFEGQTHHINFNDVPAIEFIRFVSKISQANFIFDHRELGFNITMSSGKPLSSDEVVEALVQMLRMNGFAVSAEGNYFVIHRYSEEELKNGAHIKRADLKAGNLIAGEIPSLPHEDLEFATYKLRYHQGEEIETALKKIAADMSSRADRPVKLIEAIKTIQSVKATNSLFFSGDEKTVQSLDKLIRTLDIPRRQVFIEVLVLETDSKKTTEFGLDWVGGGKFKDKVSFGAGNFSGRSNGFVDSASLATSSCTRERHFSH
jgi:type III secretion protein C